MAGRLAGLLLLVAVVQTSAKDYTVGDSSGWAPGVDYNAWANGKTFNVGDTLLFQYNPIHTVTEVTSADHSSCSAGNPIQAYRDQNTKIMLTKTGTRYFICGTSGHCANGMKLTVTVSSPSSTASAPMATAPSTTPSAPGKETPSETAPSTTMPTSATKPSVKTSGATDSGINLLLGLLFGPMLIVGLTLLG